MIELFKRYIILRGNYEYVITRLCIVEYIFIYIHTCTLRSYVFVNKYK